MVYRFTVSGDNFSRAGMVSAEMKRILQQLGIPIPTIKRIAVSMYEAEINMAVHAGGGKAEIDIQDDKIVIIMSDNGPGIADLNLAMQEGFSTASEHVRELGFGAGMGLPNMKRNSDELNIKSEVGKGTTVTMTIHL